MASKNTITRPSLGAAVGITVVAFLLLIPALGLGVLAGINVALMFGLAWYGWANTPDATTAASTTQSAPAVETTPPPARRLVPESDPFGDVDRDVLRASKLAEDDAAVTALHRFRRTLDGLSGREFHDDVARDLDMIVERSFPQLVAHYVSARGQATGRHGMEVDQVLAESVRRLTASLEDLGESQRRIDTDRLREHGDYLRNRHPVDADPFSAIRGDRS